MTRDIVLLSGPQGSGKSTTARALEDLAARSGYAVGFLKFADPLYDLHDLVLDEMERLSGKPRVIKDGKLLQLLGTDWGRTVFGRDVWVDILKAQMRELWELAERAGLSKSLIIVDDCRFENEFEAFPGALRVRLNASEEVRKTRADSWRSDTLHPSEIGLNLFDIEGRFDLYLQTDIASQTPVHCATLIMAQLHKQVWLEKRTHQ